MKNEYLEVKLPNGSQLEVWASGKDNNTLYLAVNDGESNQSYKVGYITDINKFNDILIKGQKFTNGICNFCDNVISIPKQKGIFECPACGELIINCSVCENKDCLECKFAKVTERKIK